MGEFDVIRCQEYYVEANTPVSSRYGILFRVDSHSVRWGQGDTFWAPGSVANPRFTLSTKQFLPELKLAAQVTVGSNICMSVVYY